MPEQITKRQAAVLSAYTGVMVGRFSGFHEYAEELMERPVYTHEFANSQVMEEIKRLSFQEFYDMQKHLLEDY